MMRESEIAWLAGLLEGEGSFVVRRGGVKLRIGMTDKDVLEKAREVTGLGSITGPYNPGTGGSKPVWQWAVYRSPDVARLLLAVAPLMGSRRRDQIMRAAEKLAVTKPKNRPIPHGTNAGWVREWKAGAAHCLPCLTARRAYGAASDARRHPRANRDGSKKVELDQAKPAEAPA